jgi:hypothetical protein
MVSQNASHFDRASHAGQSPRGAAVIERAVGLAGELCLGTIADRASGPINRVVMDGQDLKPRGAGVLGYQPLDAGQEESAGSDRGGRTP